MARKLFCELHPICYEISLKKEYIRRNIKDLRSGEIYSKKYQKEELPNLIKGHFTLLLRKLHGVDMSLQKSKVTNIQLACDKINGLIIHPGETFSFHKTVGRPSKKNGYQPGLIVGKTGFSSGYGGGLCQMANLIHYLVLNSPLEVTELHHHTDALYPDDRRRVPFGTGTSILYKSLDYRFKNTMDQNVQLLVWIENDQLFGELRSEKPILYRYKLIEENHHFKKEGKDYYRISQVYRITLDKETNEEVEKKLILKNHSRVMYEHELIPKDQIEE